MLKIRKFLLITFFTGLAFWVPEELSRVFLPEWKPPVSDKPSLFAPDSHTGWMHPASITMDHYGENVRGNRLGLRNGELGEKHQPRVLFLGDSFTWGWSIARDRDRYTDRLQARFGSYQFINAGITGFNTLQEFLLLKHHVDEIKPDYVVLQIFANDFPENLSAEGIYPRPHFDSGNAMAVTNYPSLANGNTFKRMVTYIGEHTYFYRQILIRLYTFLASSGFVFEDEKPEPTQADLSRGMQMALELLYQFCREHDIPVLVIFSAMEDYQVTVIESVSLQNQVTTINLDPAFSLAQHEWKDNTQHWNVYGNELVALYLTPKIENFLGKKR